jgi:hypothetical protein
VKKKKKTERHTTARREGLRGVHLARKAEIGNLDVGVIFFGFKQQILRLEIAMGDPRFVHAGDRFE